jgi:signal transduction histidine kinase
VRDIFPESDVRAALTSDADPKADLGRRLASVPADLVVADPPLPAAPGWSPTRTTLLITWVGVLSGFAAIAFSLRTATDLAERRGRFVSAVTHELRTPLTTFCMYSQMLADKMVPEGEATQRYHSTLRQESERLAGIVESVLEYARLGRRQDDGRVACEPLSVGELFEKLEPVLRRRATQSGMELVVESRGPTDRSLRTDPGTIERILFNLVDNACKYASASPDKRIHLGITVRDGVAEFRVSDHGPGIEAGERASVFQAFFRGTRHSHGSIPGLGLGLALAQGLARDVRGSLRLVDASRAEFVLSLPLG